MMGTSSSHPSPRTPSWSIAREVLANAAVEPATQSRELWRAAASDQTAQLIEKLSHPIMSRACELAGEAMSPSDALASFEKILISSHTSGLVFDMARRALARAAAVRAGQRGFAAELFSELVSYYSSRDTPSFIAGRDRVATTSGAIFLKGQLRAIARQAAAETSPLSSDPQVWAGFVRAVVDHLQSKPAR
jgi:hypothetical protein